MNTKFQNEIPKNIAKLGLITASFDKFPTTPDAFDVAIEALLSQRTQPITAAEEQRRLAVRAMLRNGKYKPTGRGKPASEYLMQLAQTERFFPRINAFVDVNNYISLKYLLPASIWDTDLAESERYRFRFGGEGESYIFNQSGQEIELEDLLTGFGIDATGKEIPLINPVKDSMRTKTTLETRIVAGVIYCPTSEESVLQKAVVEFEMLLNRLGNNVQTEAIII